MLSLSNSSICDVCAEEYSTTRVPHCIPCGHILCKACCNTIIEKTQPGRQPVCPFCRLNFQADGIRKLRLDLNASMSGPSTPRHRSGSIEANHVHEPTTWLKKDVSLPTSEKDRVRYRGEIRHLEEKVARIAAKRCSVEEVSVVLKEVEHCLRALEDEQPMSLVLSSTLLRAILTNYHAHDHATKTMKSIENNLKAQVSDLENAAGNLQAELRKLKTQQTQKVQECQTLRVELNRSKIKAAASSLALPNSALGLTSFGSAGDAVYSDSSRPTSPTSPTYDSRSSSRSQTPSVIGSPLRHLVALPPSLPSSTHQTPVTSPIVSPHGSPGYISSPRYTSASGMASPPPGQYRASSVMGHRTASSTSTVSSSSSAAAGIDRSRTPVASAYSPVAQPTSPPRPSRSSNTLPAPPIYRSTSDEEQDIPRSHISSGSSSSKMKERTTLAAGFVQRWLPGSSDSRSSSTPPVMPGSRPSHGRTPSMQAYISKTSTASPLSASAAARSVRA